MGERDSAISIALRKFFSDSPTNLSNNRPASSFKSGSCHSRAMAFAASDLPQPGTPTSMIPLGV